MIFTTLRQPYSGINSGPRVPSRSSRSKHVRIVASLAGAGNQERVQQVLQRAVVPKPPNSRKGSIKRSSNEQSRQKKRLPPVSLRFIPDTTEAESFALHFALQYECAITDAQESKEDSAFESESEKEVVSAAIAAALSRVRNLLQSDGRLRLSPQREGKIEPVALMTNRVTAHSRAISMPRHAVSGATAVAEPRQVVEFGPSIPTAAVPVQATTAAIPGRVSTSSQIVETGQSRHLQNQFDGSEAKPLVAQQLLSFERQGWTCVRELFLREEVGSFKVVSSAVV
jgi:hypothetical protein